MTAIYIEPNVLGCGCALLKSSRNLVRKLMLRVVKCPSVVKVSTFEVGFILGREDGMSRSLASKYIH